MKLFRTICVIGIAVCLATSVYAGTQSVKISGDITVRSLFRNNYDLDHDHAEGLTGGPWYLKMPNGSQMLYIAPTSDWDSYFMTTTELQIDADLTDNVSAVIRLVNQRDWNKDIYFADTANIVTWGTWLADYRVEPQRDRDMNVLVDLAYVELKEFLYSPLTLKIGRQDIWFGKGFIVGRNQRNPYYSISAPEYTAIEAFDAIRATLDYDPWTIDAIAAKVGEGMVGNVDDNDLFGINVGYIFDVYNAEVEAYWFWKNDAESVQPQITKVHNSVHTLGMRGSADPIENWTIAAEGAIQVGTYAGYINQLEGRNRAAWAIDISAECRYFKDMYAWKPVVTGEYIFYSGDRTADPNQFTSGTFQGWDPMFRGKFDSAIREFQGSYYISAQGLTQLAAAGPATAASLGPWGTASNIPEASYTNQHQVIVGGMLQPTDSLTLEGRYLAFWQHRHRNYFSGPIGGANESVKRGLYAGSEVDLRLTWDYTEDVSFDLLTAWFWPGDIYAGGQDDTATDIVGSMKLSF